MPGISKHPHLPVMPFALAQKVANGVDVALEIDDCRVDEAADG
jgi:hypothetical protein